jgi:penicillin-binding protein 1A
LGGNITVDDALVHSVNVVFVDLGCQVGTKNVTQAAFDDGIPTDATSNQGAVFLGGLDGKGVNALEMASAFATFGAKGVYAQPYAIAKILNRNGHTVYEHHVKTHRVFSEDEVGVIDSPLQRVVKQGTGTAAAIGRPVAGKTGTTQNNGDAWFIGTTPDLATGVWVGYEQPKPMSSVHGRAVTGGSFPAQVFSDVMKAGHKGIPVHPLRTVSPDALDLHKVGSTSKSADTSTTPTTATTVVGQTTTTATTQPRGGATTTAPTTPRTTRPPRPTTTSTAPPSSTPTTVAAQQEKSAPGPTTTTGPSG